MATVTKHTDDVPAKRYENGRKFTVVKKISFAADPATAADVVQCVNIAANTLVTAVKTLIVTAEGGVATATVGDAAGADSWDASINLNAAAGTMTTSTPGTDAYATTGKFYTAADTIDITLGHNVDAGVFIMVVEGLTIDDYSL